MCIVAHAYLSHKFAPGRPLSYAEAVRREQQEQKEAPKPEKKPSVPGKLQAGQRIEKNGSPVRLLACLMFAVMEK